MAITNPRYTNYGDNVRTFTEYDPNRCEDAEVVQKWMGTQWKTMKTFGHMSDDLALTHAREYAQALARGEIGGH